MCSSLAINSKLPTASTLVQSYRLYRFAPEAFVGHLSLTQSRVVKGRPTMTPLRRRYIEDLQLKHFASSTIKVYVHAVAAYARHFGKSPDKLGFKHVRQYLVHLIQDCGVSRGTYIVHLAALRAAPSTMELALTPSLIPDEATDEDVPAS